ncbi:hypothetical protein [Micromonospora sp. KC207]|uniref:hypothetical protein n=1 Tax=Micromonospora sp. KC207 TaxID=2530377 RepID=UPI001FB7A5AF|nr:hypothetical protein [Micromonospora sp. KC207]
MYLTHLECPRCGRAYPATQPQNLCGCGSPLLARYDLAAPAGRTGRGRGPTRAPWRTV